MRIKSFLGLAILLGSLFLFPAVVVASSFTSVGPSTVQVNTTGNVILCTGTGWSTGTTTISISGTNTGGAALTGTITAASTTTALIALNSGSATGTITLSDGLGHTQTITIVNQLSSQITSTNWTTGQVGSSSTGGAGSTTGAGNASDGLGWIDNGGGIANIPSATPYFLKVAGSGPNTYVVLRPSSENVLNEQEQFYIVYNTAAVPSYFAVLRWQGSNNDYLVGFGTGKAAIYHNVAGTYTGIGTQYTFPATPSNGDILCLTSSAQELTGGTTTLTVTVYDSTTGTALGYESTTDTTSALQTAGQVGITIFGAFGEFAQAYTYNDSVPQFTVSPSLVANGGSQTITLTGNPSGSNATAWVNGTTSFSLAGGTGASLGAMTINNSTQIATGTLTNGSANGQLTISDTTDTATGYVTVSTSATAYTTVGPPNVIQGVVSSNFTVTPNGIWTGTITPTSSSVAGTFTPSSLTWSSSLSAQTFTFTPSGNGTTTITAGVTSGSLTNSSGGLSFLVLPPSVVLGVTSTGVEFSPGDWSGDTGRGGSVYRQSWTNGAWVKFYWSTTYTSPFATLSITNATTGSYISYFADGILTDNIAVPSSGTISIANLSGSGAHEVDVYLRNSAQSSRWALTNAYKLTNLTVDGLSTVGTAPALRPWVMEVGDSITEGIDANNGVDDTLDSYTYLTGQALNHAGYDYAPSACGYSGWVVAGDSGGDVPAYYAMTGTAGSKTYAGNSASRWCNIDVNNSLLDSNSQISAYGSTGTTPVAITVNYGTNEELQSSNTTDMENSIEGCLAALRAAAPNAYILVYVPFDIYDLTIMPNGATYAADIKAAVSAFLSAHPSDTKTFTIDYGNGLAQTVGLLNGNTGVHPNMQGHALISTYTIQTVLNKLTATTGYVGRGRTLK